MDEQIEHLTIRELVEQNKLNEVLSYLKQVEREKAWEEVKKQKISDLLPP